jgi:hypothetical protein
MISMTVVVFFGGAHGTLQAGGWLIEALLSGCGSAWGYPSHTPASCRQLGRNCCCLATLESTLPRCFRAYWLSNFCGGALRDFLKNQLNLIYLRRCHQFLLVASQFSCREIMRVDM